MPTKCSIAVDLWKRKGDYLSMLWYRSLLLNSSVQKHHYRFLRGRLMLVLRACFLDSQCGGFPGKGTMHASLGVRAFLAGTKSCRVGALALFVDLKSGFYTVVRELVMKLHTSADDFGRILASLGTPKRLEGALTELLAQPSIVERFVRDEHLAALLSEAHTDTWFVVDGRREVARAVKGSRPGCCFADFVFNVAFAPALREARAALTGRGLLWTPPGAAAVFSAADADAGPASDYTYADDSCLCCVLRSNVGVAEEVAATCALVADTFMRRGMLVNWDRGKSAALVELRGAQSRAARRDLFLLHGGRLQPPGWDASVFLERSYVHLGTEVTVGGALGPAVSSRIRAHAQAMGPLRRTVCPRRALSYKAKLVFVESLASSRLCHSLGAWDNPTDRQVSKMQSALASGYRSALRLPHRDPTRDRHVNGEVMTAADMPDMALRLSMSRLRLLPSVLACRGFRPSASHARLPCGARCWVACPVAQGPCLA